MCGLANKKHMIKRLWGRRSALFSAAFHSVLLLIEAQLAALTVGGLPIAARHSSVHVCLLDLASPTKHL